jgi:membrane protein implicated in regulation of membrane protease activity
MSLLIAILLALFLLPSPWGIVAIVVAVVWEVAQVLGGIWWSTRRRAEVGAEALVGEQGRVVTRCAPRGQVAVRGEIWRARCEEGAEVGETVRIRALQGLILLVEPER